MQYEGDVYRPPSEARSLIIQVTIGCAHNRCTFCYMYKREQFRIRKREEILRDLEECAGLYGPYVRRVFFADGDALAAPTELLLELLQYVRAHFPYAERVSAYAAAADVLRKSEEELTMLREAGLQILYLGAESGDEEILRHIQKGNTAQEMIEAGQKLHRCGIQTSITLISGLGGRKGLERHARESARLVNGMNPDYVGLLTLQVSRDTPLAQGIRRGEMEMLTADEVAQETEIFLREIDSPGTVFRSNHASNYVALGGTFNRDIPALLKKLERVRRERLYRPDWMREL